MIREKLFYEKWILGYGPNFSKRFRVLNPPRGFCWADPFLVTEDGHHHLFFEEYHWRSGKGRICAGEIDEVKGWIHPPKPVLEEPFHLAYPFVFEWQGNYYMIPETLQSRQVRLYKAEKFPFEWRLEKVLLENILACDATLLEHGGRWWMFASVRRNADSANMDSVSLFYSETPLGPWKPHKHSPVKTDIRSSRPAGRPFFRDGVWVRPAQDCSKRYGYAITLNRIDVLTPENYQETEISKILPVWRPGLLGIHTLAQNGTLMVADGLRWAFKYAE